MRKFCIAVVAVGLVMGFSVSTMAAQGLVYSTTEQLPTGAKTIDVYGSVRVETYYSSTDKNSNGSLFDQDTLNWVLDDGSSRFGVRFKSGKVGANVEIRPRDKNANSYSGSNSTLRHWYGSYDLGWGTFIVGQTWSPTFNPICNECLLGGGGFLDGYGDMGGSARKAGLQLHMPIKALSGLLKFALLEPTSTMKGPDVIAVQGLPDPITVGPGGTGVANQTTAYPAGYSRTKYDMPAIEASLAGAFGPLSWTVRGGWNSFKVVSVTTDDDQTVNAFLGALDLTYSMGPFYVRGSGYWAQNMASFGSQAPSSKGTFGFAPALYTNATGGVDLEDASNWGFFGVAGFKVNDMFAIEAGYGQRKCELDNPLNGTTAEDKHTGIAVMLPISITPAFVITPEFVWADQNDLTVNNVTNDRGKNIYAGIYWRIDF